MLAIHINKNSYSDRWIKYCKEKKIDFIEVVIFKSDIIHRLKDNRVKFLLVHLDLLDHRTYLISHSILLAIERAGIKVFPDLDTYWHHDDKLSQKYMFEALNIPHPKTWVFYSKNEAKKWLSTASFPLVFKLRGGSASANVILLRNIRHAKKYVRKMFGKGIKPFPSVLNDYKNRLRVHSRQKDWRNTLLRLPRTILTIMAVNSRIPRERNYFFVQEFIPGNQYDTRVLVIGNRAIALRRKVRANDFRSSGSGEFDFSHENIDKQALLLAFETAGKIGMQSMACDIVINRENKPLILEVCYAMVPEPAYKTGGYWDTSLQFHHQPNWPEDLILEHMLELERNGE